MSWSATTPADGTVFTVEAGKQLTISVSAASTDPAASVHISVGSLPGLAEFTETDGNPASATLTWTPGLRQIGDYTVEFSAAGAQPVTYVIHVTRATLTFTTATSSTWAYLKRAVVVRAGADSGAAVVARLSARTTDGTQELLLLLDGVYDANTTWVHVRLPVLPNNSTGWINRNLLGGFHIIHTHAFVDRATFTFTLQRWGRVIFRARVGVGKPYWPTPAGEFYVRDELTKYANAFYGPLAFGTSARSAVLTDWPGGGFVGIHGTSLPGLIPGRISHGCIRMRNADILRLARLMPIGTPLTIS